MLDNALVPETNLQIGTSYKQSGQEIVRFEFLQNLLLGDLLGAYHQKTPRQLPCYPLGLGSQSPSYLEESWAGKITLLIKSNTVCGHIGVTRIAETSG